MGGDVRAYQFLRLDEVGEGRRDAELGVLRLKLDGRIAAGLSTEAHGVAAATSPALPQTTLIVRGETRHLLDLEHTLVDESDLRVELALDRLNAAWQQRAFRLVVGRQAITWGVTFFWPVLDLFAPFAPQRIDRDYKPGVDALRLTVPLGPFSETEMVAAAQGSSLADDGSVGGLTRIHLGPADVGVMAGSFHRDVVIGGFVAADVRGTGLRAELAFTESGDPADATVGRGSFWRATAGLDRQLTPTIALTAEAAWNGFGARDPHDYPQIAARDRVQRGEVVSLGQYYAGVSVAWQAHPLLSATVGALTNLGDGSVLLLPHVDWSLTDNLGVTLGLVAGVGSGARSDSIPGSEYGAAADLVYAAIKAYF